MLKFLRIMTCVAFTISCGFHCFGESVKAPQAETPAVNEKLNQLFAGTSTTVQLLYAQPNLIVAKILTKDAEPRFVITFNKFENADAAVAALKEIVAARDTSPSKKTTAGFDEAYFWSNLMFTGRKDHYVVGLGIASNASKKGMSLSSVLNPFLKRVETDPNLLNEIFQSQVRSDKSQKK